MQNPAEWVRGAVFATALRCRIAGKPVPCPRPRVTPRGTFYPANYVNWRTSAMEQIGADFTAPLEGPRMVAIEVRGERPKKTERWFPNGDVDNFAKSVLDILTKVRAWFDDGQVGTLIVRKRWADAENPAGYIIWIAEEAV